VRPVDLQASMVQSAEIMARWAALLAVAADPSFQQDMLQQGIDFTLEATRWQTIANEFTAKTRLMWRNGWFRDYDSVAGEWSSQQDTMHLAPVFCGAAGWGHIEQLRNALAQPPSHSSGWAPLSWPPVVMTLVGAVAAQMPIEAAELAYHFIESAYQSIDQREPDEHGGLPGVTREYHRVVGTNQDGTVHYANAGMEGYGWGALSVHLLMRYLLGLREEEAGRLTIAPALPQALRRVGATYRVEPIPWGNHILRLTCTVRDTTQYHLRVTSSAGEGYAFAVAESVSSWEWDGAWGEGQQLQLPQLTRSSVNPV
jgi:hypothetical protein